MDEIETKEQTVNAVRGANDKPAAFSPVRSNVMVTPSLQAVAAPCPTCAAPVPDGTAAASFVYALGRIEVRYSCLGDAKECAQIKARTETTGLTDGQTLQAVLAERGNRYIARQLCWVLTIEGIETYILRPRDPADFDLLIEAIRPSPRPTDVDVVIGYRGPIASAGVCNGLMVPIVAFDQIYSCDVNALMGAIPKPKKMSAKEFAPAAEELFTRIQQTAHNAGDTPEHRALNYLAVRYDRIYAQTAECYAANCSLTSVEVLQSRLSGPRRLFDVVFGYTDRKTAVVQKYSVRVDVTDEYPFLDQGIKPCYDHYYH